MEPFTNKGSDGVAVNGRTSETRSRNRYTPERLERMFQAARLYYEERKVNHDRCPRCKERIPIRESLGTCCPCCHTEWKPEDKVRLNQEDVATLLSSPIYRISRSEIQRLLSEAEDEEMIQVIVTRAPRNLKLMELEEKLRRAYPNLVAVYLVPGREELFDKSYE